WARRPRDPDVAHRGLTPQPGTPRPNGDRGVAGCRLTALTAREAGPSGFVTPSAYVDVSSCPSLSPCLALWRVAGKKLSLSEHPARRGAPSAQLVPSLPPRAAGASPRMPDHGAILPNPREFSTCQQSVACLRYRLVGGVVLRPTPVASSRPSDAYA